MRQEESTTIPSPKTLKMMKPTIEHIDASDTEKELSKIAAEKWDVDPTYPEEDDTERPLIQNVEGNDYAGYLDEYGVLGTVNDDGSESWVVCHGEDRAQVGDESFSRMEDALAKAADIESTHA